MSTDFEQVSLRSYEVDTEKIAILEGLLFIAGDDGLTVDKAMDVLDMSRKNVEEMFDVLTKRYNENDAYGIQVALFGSVYRFINKDFVCEYAKKMLQLTKKNTLSPAALETLAIVAYKQPVTRVEIEEIRGVGADMMLRKLLARDLICELGRSEAPGKPILYGVTEEFMNSFQLVSLEELPELPKFGNEESEELFE